MLRNENNFYKQGFYSYLRDNIAPSNKDDANFIWNYFNKQNSMLDMHERLVENCNDIVACGSGNLDSRFLIMVDKDTLDDFVIFFRDICEKFEVNVFDYYITVYDKTSNPSLNTWAINNEIQIVNPGVVLTFECYLPAIQNGNFVIANFKREDYIKMRTLMKDENISAQQEEELKILKQKIWEGIYYLKYTYNPITNKL